MKGWAEVLGDEQKSTARSGLTLWAVAVTAAVVPDGRAMSAAGVLIDMRAERSRMNYCTSIGSLRRRSPL